MLVLDRATVESLLGLDDVVALVREAFVALSRDEARIFPMVREPLDEAVFGVRSAYWPDRQLLGLKSSGYFPANEALDRPNHQASILLVSPTTGRPRALVDGNHVTWIRTAAVGALATHVLARPDARTIAIVGNGHQAEAQAVSHAQLLADRDPRFLVVAPRDDGARTKAKRFAAHLRSQGIEAHDTPSMADALSAADVVVTATLSRTPLVSVNDVRPGAHVTAIGSDTPGKRELDPELVRSARLVVDDREQSSRLGETQDVALDGGPPTLGEVLDGRAPGRQSAGEVTVFDSTGIGLHDLVTAEFAYARAVERDAGTWVSLDSSDPSTPIA
jgi:ornithine cyclodeaminase/alanine dehydrogenase-like protein (mu-crystallin family)